jgi:GDSL-like Lipase/Acylhydrolase family
MHIALLGDSIFDNGVYTNGEPDVAAHLLSLLPSSSRVTLCAVDGSTVEDLNRQTGRVPSDASHIVVSIGGNDALLNRDLLATAVSSTTEALRLFGQRVGRFETAYRAATQAVLALQRKTAICTIYNGNLDPPEAEVARIALMMFNDVILRCGFERGLSIIDLRLILTEKADYANPIEPSGKGGLKIARAIAGWLGTGSLKESARVVIG